MTYEMHITVTPPAGPDAVSYQRFAEVNVELGWKSSMFDHDDVDGIAGKWFLTSHADSMEQATAELAGMVHGLSGSGFTVERAKIEHVVFDTKRGDAL